MTTFNHAGPLRLNQVETLYCTKNVLAQTTLLKLEFSVSVLQGGMVLVV